MLGRVGEYYCKNRKSPKLMRSSEGLTSLIQVLYLMGDCVPVLSRKMTGGVIMFEAHTHNIHSHIGVIQAYNYTVRRTLSGIMHT